MRTLTLTMVGLISSTSICACDLDELVPFPVEPVASVEELPGVWTQRGYARVLEIGDARVTEYHVTGVSCVQTETRSIAEVDEAHERMEGNAHRFSWYELGHFTRADFERAGALPSHCRPAGEVRDAPSNFASLWHLFDENYAYFDERGIDWPAVRDEQAGRLTPESSPEELFAVVEDTLLPLADGHVWVWDGGSLGFLSGSMGELWNEWAVQYPGEPVTNPIDPRRDFIVDMRRHVVDEVLEGEGRSGLYDTLHWGWLADGVGYLNVHEMGAPDAGDLPIPEMLVAIDEAMALVMADLASARKIVVDVRFNQGGRDTMGYAIAGWFTSESVLVSRKRAYDDGRWTPDQDVVVEPRGDRSFVGPVVLLTSRNTISAAETFTLAMRALPQVTTVGTRTYGAFSDVLVRTLPNGWLVGLSNEVYEDPEGGVFEVVGVPPDVAVEPVAGGDFAASLRATLDTAVSL
ncbi:MAG: S41 family peptidase [Myxococcales bacterium FL481]|nr:MAG: S41 family peptidase [Myxococcales bacterium FL481]